MDNPFKKYYFEKFCLKFESLCHSESLGGNSARICDTTIKQLSFVFVLDNIVLFSCLSWISVDQLMKFNRKCMHTYLGLRDDSAQIMKNLASLLIGVTVLRMGGGGGV